MRGGKPVNESKVQLKFDDLVLKDVQEEDEGEYIIRSSRNASTDRHFILTVRGKPPRAAAFFQLWAENEFSKVVNRKTATEKGV